MRFTIESLIDIEGPSDAEISPDGAHVAFVLGKFHKPDKDTPHQKSIQVVEVATRAVRAFTSVGTGTNSQPCWSPDSRSLVFVSNRASKDKSQLYRIALDGGEAQPLTNLRGKVDAPQWSADGASLAFLYCPNLETDPVVVDAVPAFNRIWILNIATGDLRAVTPEDVHVFEYAWSPDGKTLAVLTSPHPNPMEGWYSAQLHTIDLATGIFQQTCTMPHQLGRLSFSPDSAAIAFVSGVMSDEGNVSGEVYTVPASGGEPRNLTPGIDFSITWIEWRAEGILYGGRQVEAAVCGWIDPSTGAQRLFSRGMFSINGWGAQRLHAANNGTFAALRESFTEPPNVYTGLLNTGEWSQLTDLPYNQTTFRRSTPKTATGTARTGSPYMAISSIRRIMFPVNPIPCLPMCMVALHGHMFRAMLVPGNACSSNSAASSTCPIRAAVGGAAVPFRPPTSVILVVATGMILTPGSMRSSLRASPIPLTWRSAAGATAAI